MGLDLVVVMPVYNEEECIVGVVRDWRASLASLGMDFRLLVLNDGSKDGTAQALLAFEGDERIEVINKPNAGHGPTILMGYRLAAPQSEWVFQCDSDDEMSPSSFAKLWSRRDKYDALFAMRHGRTQNVGRAFISAISRLTVRFLFGRAVRDVNVPYRLIRSDILQEVVGQIPDDTFAPNVIISGAIATARRRVLNVPVPFRDRQTGTVSIMKWKLWKAALRSFWQTLRVRPRLSRKPRR